MGRKRDEAPRAAAAKDRMPGVSRLDKSNFNAFILPSSSVGDENIVDQELPLVTNDPIYFTIVKQEQLLKPSFICLLKDVA